MAALYDSQGRYTEAEPLYKRALAIWEKAIGPDYPHVILVMESMAELYKNIGNEEEAKRLQKRVQMIRLKNK